MLNKVIKIVKEASKIMLNDSFNVMEKDGVTNLVTTNDIAVQDYLVKELSKLLPNSGFFLEEGDERDSSEEYVWIIDPIDGTTNYARHISVCAISVALVKNNEVILGVIYNPYQKLLFHSVKGKGAYLNRKRIHVSTKSFKEAILYTAFSAYNKKESYKAFRFAEDIFPYVNDLRRTGSAAFEIASIGAGRGDMFLEIKLQPWDYAAASLILTEAGGYISGINENELPLFKPTIIIAANNKENHHLLVEKAKEYFN